MSDDHMTPQALRLLDVVREAESPSELEMRRVRRAIAAGTAGAALTTSVAKAATAVAPKGAAVTAVKSAALLTTIKGLAAVAVLASIGAGGVWLSRHRSTEPVAGAPEVRRALSAPADVTAPSTLLGELTLLQRAQRALAGGAPDAALSLAAEHATRYPRSQLSRERDGVRVFAYCALGRTADAHALAAELLKGAPRSPLRASLEQSCAAPLPALASPAR